MKKLLALMLVLLFSLGITGCKNKNDKIAEQSGNITITEAECQEIAEKECVSLCVKRYSQTDSVRGFSLKSKKVAYNMVNNTWEVNYKGHCYGEDKNFNPKEKENFSFTATIKGSGTVTESNLITL